MPHDDLLIITCTYRNYSILKDFFSSLDSQTDSAFSVFVGDTTEEPQNVAMPTYARYHHLDNKGYAYCLNKGIQYGIQHGYHFFCVVNSDITFDSKFVANTKASIKKNSSSLMGGKIYYAPGYEYHKDRYQEKDLGKVLWYAGGITDWQNAYTLHVGVDEVDVGQYDTLTPTQFITGCLMAFDESVIRKTGYFDESYFLYYEDADFCERAKRAQVPLLYDPSLVIWHKNSQSTQGAGSVFQQRYQKRNRLRYALAYAPLNTKLHVFINYLLNHD
ncbi:MAG: glycosyltransferase family 2 protein [Candidatus Roizmanbacteria bacterium]|nr:glycosyltransferase family 2 protein [Candidatus Roizmanbacteria bacterium]